MKILLFQDTGVSRWAKNKSMRKFSIFMQTKWARKCQLENFYQLGKIHPQNQNRSSLFVEIVAETNFAHLEHPFEKFRWD